MWETSPIAYEQAGATAPLWTGQAGRVSAGRILGCTRAWHRNTLRTRLLYNIIVLLPWFGYVPLTTHTHQYYYHYYYY